MQEVPAPEQLQESDPGMPAEIYIRPRQIPSGRMQGHDQK